MSQKGQSPVKESVDQAVDYVEASEALIAPGKYRMSREQYLTFCLRGLCGSSQRPLRFKTFTDNIVASPVSADHS